MTDTRYVIIGAGPAGTYAAESIRQLDPGGQITIITDELYPFYSRPGIAYLLIDMVSAEQIIGRRNDHWATHRIDLRVSVRVEQIDTAAQQLVFSDGSQHPYDKLLIATGAAAVPPDRFPGGDLDGVITFDTLEDAHDLTRRGRQARQAVVVGGGITAMEVVEGLAHMGVETHYLLRKDSLWSSVFNQEESRLVAHQIVEHGVHLHYHEEIVEIYGEGGRVTAVRFKSGDVLPVDIVGVCIGVRPKLALVAGTGLEVDRGILVDEYLRSSVPNIYAAGDCAQIYDRWSGEHRLDSLWPSALESGRAAGINMAGGAQPYHKRVSFNAALIFGVHITAIGQVGTSLRHDEEGGIDKEELSYISRGSSEVWRAFPGGGYTSAWDQAGTSTRRLAMRENQIVGALLLGNQDLADPLRDLINHQVDVSPERAQLEAGGTGLEAVVRAAWRRWQGVSMATR